MGLSDGFLELFGACCHGSQLQSLAGPGAGQEGGGGVCPPARQEQASGLSKALILSSSAYTLPSFASSPVTRPIALSRWWVQNPLEMGWGPKTSALPPRPCVLPSLPQREPLPRRAGATRPTAFFWKLALSSYCWAATCFLVLLCRTDAFCSEHVDSR